jgi:1,4-alpha-glucan branching enzyme
MNFRKIFWLQACVFILSGLPVALRAQVITTSPAYPVDTDSATIVFDATLGDGGLNNVSPPIYAHTGVITSLSTSTSDWKYVVAAWGVNLPKALMTPLGNNKYKLTLKPSIRDYYGVPAGEKILKIAFVFRNSDGSKAGKDVNSADIFADVYDSVMSVNIVLPAGNALFLRQNTDIPVSAISPTAETMKIYVNNTLTKTAAGNSITDTIPADNFGSNWMKQWVRIEAINATTSAADSFSYTVIPASPVAELPAGISDGINYIDSATAVVCLYAPQKDNVFVIGDFNGWVIDSSLYMNVTPDGKRYWKRLNNLVPKQEYIFQYLVDGAIRIGDPYADKVSDPNDQYIDATTYPGLKPYPAGKTTDIATFLQTGQYPYPWDSTTFSPPQVTDLVIYELLLRDFTANHDYPSLIDTLGYLKNLGINAIELMPVMEFEGNLSWGYNPDYSFAPDKYYGTKTGLKQFVEAAHRQGIAVILDIVCNHHFGSSPLARLYWDSGNQRPAAGNPWFNPIPKHPYNVGCDFNHESADTKAYMERLIRYWLTEYHIDGYRFDLSKGFTQKDSYPNNVSLWGQYDSSRIAILENYAGVIHSVKPGAYAIMEHFADNSEETVLSGKNMLVWGNMNGSYINGAGGWTTGSSSDYSWGSYKKRGWAQPHLVTYMESHDEERVMYKNIASGNNSKPPYLVRDTTIGLKRIELNANFFFTIPGPKMIWQFGELGYDYSINYPSGTSASRLDPKPIRWDYQNDWRRRYAKNICAALIGLKKTQPVFSTTTFSTDLTSAVKRIWLTHSSMDATVLGNFDVVARNVAPNFTRTGMWYEFYTGDSLSVSDTAASLVFEAGEYRLYTTVKLEKPHFTAIDENKLPVIVAAGHLLVYPNPSDGQFNFIVNVQHSVRAEITVYNIYGDAVKRSVSVFNEGINTFTLDIGPMPGDKAPSGIYFFRLDAGNLHQSGKLIVK